MGMFDYTNYVGPCGKCGKELRGWQTKDREAPFMDTLDYLTVTEFYQRCDCGAFNLYKRKHASSIEDFELVVDSSVARVVKRADGR